MRGRSVDQDEINRPLAEDLIGDAGIAAMGVARSMSAERRRTANVTKPEERFTNTRSVNFGSAKVLRDRSSERNGYNHQEQHHQQNARTQVRGSTKDGLGSQV